MSSTNPLRSTLFNASGRPERLLRAAVTSFCSLARPGRRDQIQLDDLATPLLGQVSDDTLRYIAAALSQSPHAPAALVRKLADLSVDIAAPLLMRSTVLTAIDLVALIGRHGGPHARAIAGRPDLDDRIRSLIRALGALDPAAEPEAEPAAHETSDVDAVRDQLRSMMAPSSPGVAIRDVRLRWDGDPGIYAKLRATALAGVPALFQTALADGLGVEVRRAATLADASDLSGLLIAFRALDLAEEKVVLLLTCVRQHSLTSLRAINTIVDAYAAIDRADAERVVAGWRRVSDTPGTATANENLPARGLRSGLRAS